MGAIGRIGGTVACDGPFDEACIERLLDRAAALEDEELVRFLLGLPVPVRRAVAERWFWQAHGGQQEPPGAWRTWLLMGGRTFGKTRAGAEWVWARARENPEARIALIAADSDDLVKVTVFGDSGLFATARADETPKWIASKEMLLFPSGATGFGYSAETPDKLRGPQHHFAWCDELAKWPRAEAAWNMLKMGLRLGERPRTVITTTPRPIPLLKRLVANKRTAVTGGRTAENVHVSDDYQEEMVELYGGTRLERQELSGELIEDFEGALWTREMIERCRIAPAGDSYFSHGGGGMGTVASNCPRFERIVVGVDPPASADGDACGIIVCGLDADGTGYVLADLSVQGLSPERWAAKVAAAAEAWEADRIVAEANQGGDMVEALLRGAGVELPVTSAFARLHKAARAEPVSALFERGRVKLAGSFPELEDQLCGLLIGGGYAGPGRSPDRADAMVWALSELMVGRKRGRPRIRML